MSFDGLSLNLCVLYHQLLHVRNIACERYTPSTYQGRHVVRSRVASDVLKPNVHSVKVCHQCPELSLCRWTGSIGVNEGLHTSIETRRSHASLNTARQRSLNIPSDWKLKEFITTEKRCSTCGGRRIYRKPLGTIPSSYFLLFFDRSIPKSTIKTIGIPARRHSSQ